MTRVVLVPGVPALLPAYRSLDDPVAPLRAACLEAVRWLGPDPRVVADEAGMRVAEALLEGAGVSTRSAVDGLAARPAEGLAARPAAAEGAGVSTRSAVDGLAARPAEGLAARPAEAEGAGVSTRSAVDGLAARPAAAEGAGVSTSSAVGVLVVGNGSARRTEASPGPFDPRAVPFDDALGVALRGTDRDALRAVDAGLAEELWAATACFAQLADLLEGAGPAAVDYDDAPYGVQYWVMRWES